MNFKHSPLAEYCCFVVVFILSGCASITGSTSYPKEWASIDADITADGCPNVEGTYSNRGTHTFPVELGGPPRLSDVFTRMCRGAGLSSPRGNYQIWPDLPDAISVRILQTPDLLTIHFLGNNGDADFIAISPLSLQLVRETIRRSLYLLRLGQRATFTIFCGSGEHQEYIETIYWIHRHAGVSPEGNRRVVDRSMA